MMPFDQTKYKRAFNKERYDSIDLSIPKGKKQTLKAIADREGKSAHYRVS